MMSFLQYRTPAFASTPSYYQRNHRSIPCIGGNKRPITQTQLHLSRSQSRTTSVNELADDDLVALPFDAYITSITSTTTAEDGSATAKEGTTKTTAESIITDNPLQQLRLCVVRNEQFIIPLIRHEDDVETDLFLDPRHLEKDIKLSDVVEYINSFNNDKNTQQTEPKETSSSSSSSSSNDDSDDNEDYEVAYYGVGWYGQRPVPSLGGGPGYGATADEIWSVEEEVLEMLLEVDGVEIPVIDVGMAHGEKARGGALF